jgi:hypothetical protein
VEHSSGISPTALMFICFIIVAAGMTIVLRSGKNDKDKK